MAAPSAWTASIIGAKRRTLSRVSTQLMPGDVRPSAWRHDEPWMISPTP